MKTIAQQLNVTKFPFIIKDSKGNSIYCQYSDGYWCKREYDSNSNEIYYESSNGKIIDKRPKTVELTLNEIAEKFNIDVNLLKIKK